MAFKFRIITPYGEFFNGEVDIVNVKTKDGVVGILKNHIPLVSPVEISCLTFRVNGEERKCVVSDGILYVEENQTRIIVNSCEYIEDIDLERALESKKRAEERLASKNENIDIKRAELSLRRAINRINASKN